MSSQSVWLRYILVYVTASALPTFRKYWNCNMQVRQIFKCHQVGAFGYANRELRSRGGLCGLAVSVHQNIAWPFSRDLLHAVCIPLTFQTVGGDLSLIFGIYSHPLRFLFHVGCEMLQHVHHLKHVWIVFVIRFLFNFCHTACRPHTGWPSSVL